MKKNKVVIWGHKNPWHTHFFIHNAYFKAFRALGWSVFWFDDNDDVGNFDFNNVLFFTEDQASKNIPLIKNAKYILHHCKLEKYDEAGCSYINLGNFLINDLSRNSSIRQQINYFTEFEPSTKTLYQPWATDLLPDECAQTIFPLDESLTNINYVGTIYGDLLNEFNLFNSACVYLGKKFENHVSSGAPFKAKSGIVSEFFRKVYYKTKKHILHENPITDDVARKLIETSYIAPDIRNSQHRAVGYVPCRIFKNISYGKIPATNSLLVKDFFPVALPFSQNVSNLLTVNIDAYNLSDSERIFNYLLQDVKLNHTYLNRIESILKVL